MQADSVWPGEPQQALPFFKELDGAARRHPALVGARSDYSAGAPVIVGGNQPSRLFLLLSGAAKAIRAAGRGEAVPSAAFLACSPLDSVGEPAGEGRLHLIDGADTSICCQTLDSCLFLTLEREPFLDWLARSPALIPRLFEAMKPELRTISGRLLSDVLGKQAAWVIAERELFRSLNQIPLAAGEMDTWEQALQFAVDRVCASLGWPVGHVYALDERQPDTLFSSPIWHLEAPGRYEEFKKLSEITPFPSGIGVPGRALAGKRAFWSEDMTQLPSCPRASAARQAGLRAGMAFPVMIGDEVVAVLEFFCPRVLPPDVQWMEVIESIGVRLGKVADRKRYEKQLIHNAYHDVLTGLPNRALFLDHLGLSLARAKRNQAYLFATLFLDLDRFKVINDSLGHVLADRSLEEVARRLQSMTRASDTVARFGGDEFAILLDDLKEITDVPRTVERIRKELQQPIRIGDREVYTSASIGVVLNSPEYAQPEEILQDADIALYQAKAQGRARSVIFDSVMRERAMKLLQAESELRRALDRGELRLHYQPIISLERGNIAGFEALLRWQHPERGLIAAGEFLPLAEETEIILPISDWILRETCEQLRAWQQEFPSDPPVSISVNLTTKYLAKPDLVEEIVQIIEACRVDPRALRLEITESQIMEDPKAIAKTLMELSDYGVQVYIDDFGTGYSSLSYLSKFRVQALKIDYSFISKLNADDRDSAIVKAVVGLGLNLGLEVVAEGVETPDQLNFLRAVQCQYAQGYYFCRPLDKDSAARLLDAGGRLDKETHLEPARLRAFDLFAELSDAEIEEISIMARPQTIERSRMVIRQGQVGGEVYLLEKGSVDVVREDKSARHFLARLSAPAFFGERALLDPERIRTASVTAATDLRLLVIRIDSFLALLRKHPSLRERMRGTFVERT